LTIAASTDRNAFREITKHRESEVPLEISPFRNVPGENPIVKKKAVQGGDGISQNSGIDHRQMIRTNDPRPLMNFEELVAFVANLANVSDPIACKAYHKINQRTHNKNGNPAEKILQTKMMIFRFAHV